MTVKLLAALTGVFVALNGGSVALKLDDLADEFVPADLDQFVHFGAGHVLGYDDYEKERKERGELSGKKCARWEDLRGPATLKMRPYLDSPISKLSTMLFLVLCVFRLEYVF